MAGLIIVIALLMTVISVLVAAFIAVSFAISRGHRVRSVIWDRSDHPGQGTAPLTGSSRRR
jgi:ABC-type arginine/histidine transport system permease subunit